VSADHLTTWSAWNFQCRPRAPLLPLYG